MSPLKISVITVCYNASSTIRRCIESVIRQDYPNLEYIIVDGASTDGTQLIAAEYKDHIARLVSEPDKGLYDAMNKGIALATGDIIGILNADDFFIHDGVISAYAQTFASAGADVVYANLNYIDTSGKVVRKWRSGLYKQGVCNWGWMPAHPAFYAKKELFEKLGDYRLNYGSAADYELMLRFLHKNQLKVIYLNQTVLHMQSGGISNKNLLSRVKAYNNDFKAMQSNGIQFPLLTILLKPLRKVFQYWV